MATSQKAEKYIENKLKLLSYKIKERLNGRTVIGFTKNFSKEIGNVHYNFNESPYADILYRLFDPIDIKIMFDLPNTCEAYMGPIRTKAFVISSTKMWNDFISELEAEL